VKQISNKDGLQNKQAPSMYSIKIEEQLEDMVKWLYIGTNIPVWPEFYPYILHDLNVFHTKSLLLKEDDNIAGHVLVYHEDTKILYFGFFGVLNHEHKKIDFLISRLIDYGKQNNFSKIIGPINIPIVIYGWGFLEKNGNANLYIGKPINPPIYQDLFFQKGFIVKTKEVSLEGPVLKFSEKMLSNYDEKNYDLIHPKNWKEVLDFKQTFFKLNANLSPGSVITPGINNLYENYVKFLKDYGHLFMITFLRHKPKNEIVGSFFCVPNPFRRNDKGIYDSYVVFSILIDKEHQGKGMGGILTLTAANEAWKNKIRYNASPFESKASRSIALGKKFGLKLKRTHLILEYLI